MVLKKYGNSETKNQKWIREGGALIRCQAKSKLLHMLRIVLKLLCTALLTTKPYGKALII